MITPGGSVGPAVSRIWRISTLGTQLDGPFDPTVPTYGEKGDGGSQKRERDGLGLSAKWFIVGEMRRHALTERQWSGCAAAPPAAAQPWPSAARRPDRRRRHSLAAGHRCPVARSAGALRPVAHGVLALSALAAAGGVGAGADHPPSAGRCEGRAGLESALPRWHHGACPPARRGGQKGGGDQALGRSRGGFSSKIHLRTERSGKPITSLLTAGQRHEAPHLPALLEQGAVRRPGRGRPACDQIGCRR